MTMPQHPPEAAQNGRSRRSDVDVDTTLDGTTELRIHGVSGTPPESMLQHPHVRLVAGDAKAGFYRRWFPARNSLDVPGKHHREAYAWGGLTSGGGSRALWLLLLPFALVNLASWTEAGRPDEALARRRTVEALLRLFALTLTLTFVLAIATVTMDLLAWQCAAPGSRCAAQDGLAGTIARVGAPGRRLALGLVAPAALVGLLWYLGHRTWRDYERQTMPPDSGRPRDFSLADPRFWNGDLPVRRLRALHIAAAWALLALLVVDPVRRHLSDIGSPSVAFAVVVEAVAAALGLGCLAVAPLPGIADRRTPDDDPSPAQQRLEVGWRWLPWLGLGVLAAAVVVAVAPGTPAWRTEGAMPLLSGLLHTGFCIQATLLLVLLALNRTLPRDPRPLIPVALRGHALPVLATIGWLLAGGFAAGLAMRVGDWLGKPVADDVNRQRVRDARAALESSSSFADRVAALDAPDPLVVPAPFTWVALVAAVLAIVVLPVLIGASVYRLGRLTADQIKTILVARPDADRDRARAVGRGYALAAMTDYAPRYLGRAVLAASALVVLGTVMYGFDPSWPQRNLPILTGFGSWAVGALALLLIALGRAAYRTPQLRRTVGILWDLASFWPRAVHPLAPPCYSERVLPDLVERSDALTRDENDRLLLSAHSQGTVIALAAVLQMGTPTARRTALLTYGSPLTRLYAAFFPGYFNRAAYEAAIRQLDCDVAVPNTWPWRNLYRRSDPIGGWVLAPAELATGDGVDRQLVDPIFDRRPGDPAWPATYGHSDYWVDDEFALISERVLQLRR